MFSDKTSLFNSCCNIKELFEIATKEMKHVFEWYSINKLSLNADK